MGGQTDKSVDDWSYALIDYGWGVSWIASVFKAKLRHLLSPHMDMDMKKWVVPNFECFQSVRTKALCTQTSGIYQINIVSPQKYETVAPTESTFSLKTLRPSAKMLKFELKLTTLDSVFPHTDFFIHMHIRL